MPADNSHDPAETLLARTGPVAIRSTAHAAPATHRALQQALHDSGVGALGGPWPAAQSLLYDQWEVVVSRLGVVCAGAGAWGALHPQGPCVWPGEGHVVEGLRCKAALLVHRLPEVRAVGCMARSACIKMRVRGINTLCTHQDGALPTMHADVLLEPLALTITPALTASLHAMSPAFSTLAKAMQGPEHPPAHVLGRPSRQVLLLDVALHRVQVVWQGALTDSLHWDGCVTDVRVEVGVSDRDARVLVRGVGRGASRALLAGSRWGGRGGGAERCLGSGCRVAAACTPHGDRSQGVAHGVDHRC